MTRSEAPPICGLVLAGGRSRRMGRDKGSLELLGITQAERCVRLLESLALPVLVSVSPSQASDSSYRDFSLVIDDDRMQGPAAGLLAAWSRAPDCALLAWAVDMPLVEAADLRRLLAARDAGKRATAYRNASAIVEPLCTIWEPIVGEELKSAAAAAGSPSLRRLLETADVKVIEPGSPANLASVNTPEDLDRARAVLRSRDSLR